MALAAVLGSTATLAQPQGPIGLRRLATYHTGIFEDGAAEISAYDKVGKRLFTVNAAQQRIDAINLADPAAPVLAFSMDITPYGSNANSVVTGEGFLAAAMEADPATEPGKVVFFDLDGNFLNAVTVGALPDMIAISPTGTHLLVANEGEPNDDYTVDPAGSISVIDITAGVAALTQAEVHIADFSAFESDRWSFDGATADNWEPETAPTHDIAWGATTALGGFTAIHGDHFFGAQGPLGSGAHTLTLHTSLAGAQHATLSFAHFAQGLSGNDSLGYWIAFDGQPIANGTYVNLATTTGWTPTSITIDPVQHTSVTLRFGARINGAGLAGIDDIKLSRLAPGVRVFGNNDRQTVQQDLEPEYIAISEDGTTAWASIQEANALAIINVASAQITRVVPLGAKDHLLPGQGLDASNDDDAVHIANWPVKGLYMPDAISAIGINGNTYVFSANEGDSRDYDGYGEETRIRDLVLDPAAFPDAEALQQDEAIGRLKTTVSMGDTDLDGDVDELHAFGARSFSVWNAAGEPVWDSGDAFEQHVAALFPDHFNSDHADNDSFDDRSDDKGPEPEALTTARIDGRTYAFIGLERMGGVMVYDVTDPAQPQYLQYFNDRNFAVDAESPEAGDLGPEGLLFIPKADSPNGRDLLVVSNEVSGTIGILQVDRNNTVNGPLALASYDVLEAPVIGVYGDTIREGGFSGLHYLPGTDNEFLIVGDRGPNADAGSHPLATGSTLVFPFPDYAPKVFHTKAQNGALQILGITPITRPDQQPGSGLPLPVDQGNTGETPWSDTLATVLPNDAWGIDSEGLVIGNNGEAWICEEYATSVWHLDTAYRALERYTPFAQEPQDMAIDSIYGKRRPNRGFEGVAYTPNGRIYAIVQNQLNNPDNSLENASRLHRILEIDPQTGQQRSFGYEHAAPMGAIRNKDRKIGDMVAVNNTQFLVLEHAERNGWNEKNVYLVDLGNATPIPAGDFGGATFEQLNDAATATTFGVQVAAKTLVLDLLESGWDLSHDKPEGITILDAQTIAIVNDNDFGIDAPAADGHIVLTGKTSRLYVYTLPEPLDHVSPYCHVDLGSDTLLCSGQAVTLDAGAGDLYEWNTGASTQAITVDASGTYQVKVTNAQGCVAYDQVEVVMDPCLGVVETRDAALVATWPNPADHTLHVQLPAASTTTLDLYAVDGRRVQHLTAVAGSTTTMDVSALENGTYLLRASGASGTRTRTVVVQH